MRHFTFHEKGAPYPATCLGCGNISDLFDLNRELQGGGRSLLCVRCATELAQFIGYAEKAPLETTIEDLRAEIVSRETQLTAIPNKVEELINGIRSSLTDFIFAVSDSNNTNKPASVQDTSGSDEPAEGPRKAPKRVNSAPVKSSGK